MTNDDFADLEEGRTRELASRSMRTPASFVLRVVEGPDAGRLLAFDDTCPGPILVGQSPACTLRLSDPLVSRRHAALEIAGDDVKVTDLESTNGTVVSGLRIDAAYLRGGEMLRLGSTLLRIDRQADSTRRELSVATRFGRVRGASRAMRRLYPLFERFASSDVPVVIEGETGTGKEVLAESLHEASSRAAKPFVVFDCTTVQPNLIESELFGHAAGASTGAVGARKGVFELADEGTLFIDEIGESI